MVLPFWHFFLALLYLYLAGFVFIKNPKSLLNRLYMIFLLCFVLWSIALIFIHNPLSSKKLALLFVDISAPGWVAFSSFFLWFTCSFSGKTRVLKSIWFYIAIFVIPLIFIYIEWNHLLFQDVIKQPYGWKPMMSLTPWTIAFLVYYTGFMFLGIFILLYYAHQSKNVTIKKQTLIFIVTVTITVFLGTLTDVIFPIMNFHVIPNLGSSFAIIWALGFVYVMLKYKFLSITPASAASNILSTMYDSLVLLRLTGIIETANKATLNLLEYDENELKGKAVDIFFPDDDLKNGAVKMILGEKELKNKDFIFKTKSGRQIPVLFSSSILQDEMDRPAGIVCVARDISERKKLEEEMLKIKKLESIGILAGGIAHDFNNLLSVIIGNISMALNEVTSVKRNRIFLSKAQEASLKAVNLAGKFLIFSDGGWIIREKVDLTDVIFCAKDSLHDHLKVSIQMDIPADIQPAQGDEDHLCQLFSNLLMNAAESMPRGGEISIRMENCEILEKNESGLKVGNYVKVKITDTGEGIPPGDIEKVFDPYFSTKEKSNQKGMGLGLTICYWIVKKHEGHIAIQSTLNKGTTVTVYLPHYVGSLS